MTGLLRPAWTLLAALCLAVVAATGHLVHAQDGPPRLEITPIAATDTVHAGSSAKVAIAAHLPPGAHVNSDKPKDEFLIPIAVTVTPPPGVTLTETVFPKPGTLRQAGTDLLVFEGDFAIGLDLRIADDVKPGELTIPGKVRYQACNETTCFPPVTLTSTWTLRVVPSSVALKAQHQDVFARIAFGSGTAPGAAPAAVSAGGAPSSSARPAGAPEASPAETIATLNAFTTLSTTGGYMGSADFLTFVRNAENGIKEKGLFDGRGPLAILLVVFLGGLALNLTPCVLPMIPINLAIIGAGAQSGSRGRGLLLGSVYGAAMAAVYGILGLVVILTAGTFGTINSSAWFNGGIAVLFVFLALAMFDVIVIDFSRFSTMFSTGESGRGTLMVAGGMGAIAALLAGACVAPVVIQVVLLSSNLYATGTSSALALPFVLGLGMALPWPIAGAGIAALPRPGAWMVRIKQVFGVVILATAIYYGYEAYTIMSNRWVDASEVTAGVQEELKAGWHPTLASGLAEASRDGKPVLIDMWATWCKNCLTMNATTFKDPQVIAALSSYSKIKFQAEDPDDPLVREVMKHFDAIGLPTYVVLRQK